jgi:outer membrane protein OmpA-like peptidoglycan-associated protein
MTSRNAGKMMMAALTLVGFVSMAHAETIDRDVVHDAEGTIVHATNSTCVRTKWETDRDACGAQRCMQHERRTRSVSEFTREERTVYFDFDHFNLSSDSTTRLDTLVGALKADQSIKEARIVGYADRIGSIPYNDRLSQKRAEAVRSYLFAKGYSNARVTETRWVGKTEPSTNCPAQQDRSKLIACLQNDRRVEVEVDLQNDGQ